MEMKTRARPDLEYGNVGAAVVHGSAQHAHLAPPPARMPSIEDRLYFAESLCKRLGEVTNHFAAIANRVRAQPTSNGPTDGRISSEPSDIASRLDRLNDYGTDRIYELEQLAERLANSLFSSDPERAR